MNLKNVLAMQNGFSTLIIRMDRMIRTGVQMLEAGELAINALHDELSQQTNQYSKLTLSA